MFAVSQGHLKAKEKFVCQFTHHDTNPVLWRTDIMCNTTVAGRWLQHQQSTDAVYQYNHKVRTISLLIAEGYRLVNISFTLVGRKYLLSTVGSQWYNFQEPADLFQLEHAACVLWRSMKWNIYRSGRKVNLAYPPCLAQWTKASLTLHCWPYQSICQQVAVF